MITMTSRSNYFKSYDDNFDGVNDIADACDNDDDDDNVNDWDSYLKPTFALLWENYLAALLRLLS